MTSEALSRLNERVAAHVPIKPDTKTKTVVHLKASPREKVGTALKARIEGLLKIKSGKGCGCTNLATQMDGWGIAGCERERETIVNALVSNREMLADSLKSSSGFVSSVIGFGAQVAPDFILRQGANWLLDQAIEDARNMPKPPPPIVRACRVRREPRQSVEVRHNRQPRLYRDGRSNFHPALIGVPIDRTKLQSHIMYHIMPLSGETEWVWRRHCDWLREVRANYNGRLIVGVVIPGEQDAWQYCPPEAVYEALAGLDAEFITAPNDTGSRKNRKHARQGKGEGVLFPQMLKKLQTSDPNHVAFYGHAKGVTRPQTPLGSAIHLWAEAMFETVFRNHNAAVDTLDNHGICGSFRMPGGYRDGGPGIGSNWFYSGTFFAMRLADVFSRKWEYLPTHYGCVEQWPRLNFDKNTQAACLFFDNVTNLYDESYWCNEVTPAFEKWKQEHGTR